MQLQEAIHLIQSAPISQSAPQNWADLGCGKGLFTQALASLLPANSHIHAVDTNKKALKQLPNNFGTTSVQSHQLDFLGAPLPFQELDGILMANSLHYVKDKEVFLKKIQAALKPSAHLLIIEYENARANPWVPYPISFEPLKRLLKGKMVKIGEMPSRFGGTMYAAWGNF